MDRLPPDLEHVGDHLVAAAGRRIAARRHRAFLLARTGATAVAAVLAAAALLPGTLGPAMRAHGDLAMAPGRQPAVPLGCDQPRGRHAAPPVCAAGEPIRPGRPRRW
jgi:hypothetical protein